MDVLIIGLGSIAAKHIQALKSISEATKIFALRSNPSVIPDAREPGIVHVSSIQECKAPDFIIISNPTYLHYKTIERVVNLGVPLFIEKPVFHSLEGVKSLLEKIQENGVLTYVACNLRFHPALQFLKRKLEEREREINEVNIYCGSYLPGWRAGKNFRDYYSVRSDTGGGVHLDLIHEIDYCYWLFGKPKSVSAEKTSTSTLQIDSVDYAHFSFSYASFTASITLNYYRIDPKRYIEVLFKDSTWMVDLLECKISDENGAIIFAQEFSMQETYVMQLNYFIEKMRAKSKPMNSIDEAVEILSLSLK